jgi:hypothetical protein
MCLCPAGSDGRVLTAAAPAVRRDGNARAKPSKESRRAGSNRLANRRQIRWPTSVETEEFDFLKFAEGRRRRAPPTAVRW